MATQSSSNSEEADLKAFCLSLRDELKLKRKESDTSKPIPETTPGKCETSRSRASKSTEKPLDLSFATVNWLRDSTHKVQMTNIRLFEAWYEECKGLPVEEWDMQKLAVILTKIFFLNDLPTPLNFYWDTNLEATEKAIGLTAHLSNNLHIRLDPNDHKGSLRLDSHHTAILSVFLHELLHGYLYHYCCDGLKLHTKEGACTRSGVTLWQKGKGNGHCIAWFLVACQIDLCMQRLLKFNGHLASFRELIGHCEAGGTMLAGDWALIFSVFSWEEVAKLFGYIRSDGVNGKKSERDRLKYHLMTCMESGKVMQVWAEQGEMH